MFIKSERMLAEILGSVSISSWKHCLLSTISRWQTVCNCGVYDASTLQAVTSTAGDHGSSDSKVGRAGYRRGGDWELQRADDIHTAPAAGKVWQNCKQVCRRATVGSFPVSFLLNRPFSTVTNHHELGRLPLRIAVQRTQPTASEHQRHDDNRVPTLLLTKNPRLFQDFRGPHKKFSRTFSEPANV